jgi:hypothetical protein
LLIGASYIALSDYVTIVPRLWLPGLTMVLVVALLTAHARGRNRLARGISFVLLGVVTTSIVLREFFLVTAGCIDTDPLALGRILLSISQIPCADRTYAPCDAGHVH